MQQAMDTTQARSLNGAILETLPEPIVYLATKLQSV